MSEKETMHAIQFDSYGGGAAGLKHVQVSIPKPSKGELLLKIEAVSINPLDWKVQKGMFRPLFPFKFPWIPCTDVAGEVVEVGPGVNNFKVGDKVVAILNMFYGGGLSEYAVSTEKMTVYRPSEVSAAEGAGLPAAGLTAFQALTKYGGIVLDKTSPPTNILITSGSSGVGHYAVQLANLANTHVTAVCGARNIDFVKSLGADEVLDYKTPEGASLKSPSGKKYDVVINCAMSIPWSTFEPNLSPNGKVIDVTFGLHTFLTAFVKTLTWSKKKMVPFFMMWNAKDLGYMVGLVKEGKIKTVIDSKYPLDRAEEAWAKSLDGHATGKIVVEP